MKIKYQHVLKYLGIFFVCLVLGNANINGLNPFLYAFFFACLYIGLDEKILSCFCLLGATLCDFCLQTFLIALTTIVVGLIFCYLFRLIKRKLNLVFIYLGYFMSQITYLYYNFYSLKDLVFYFVLGFVALFAFITVNQVLGLRKNCMKLTLDESICFLFFIALLGVGISPIEIFGLEFYRFVLTLAILCFVAFNSVGLTYSITLVFAFGVCLKQGNLFALGEFAVISLLASAFSMPNKVKISCSAIISCVFVECYFYGVNFGIWISVLPVLIACLIFLCLPNKWLNSLGDLIFLQKTEISSRNLINTTRKMMRKRMAELSNIFLEMKEIHLKMLKKELTPTELKTMLMREINNNVCKNCIDKTRCNRALGTDNLSDLESLINVAIQKGKVNLIDLPSNMVARCNKVNNLVAQINRLCDEYRQYKNMLTDINNVKILLADQMDAVSRLLLKLGKEIDVNVSFDMAKENKIIARLLGQNILCNEVLLYTENTEDASATLLIKGEMAYSQLVEKTVSEILKMPMQVVSIKPNEQSDFNLVTMGKISKYDCCFGLASCNKSGNQESGDCHSVIRLNKTKFLLALCDGMGAGKPAHEISAMTLGLIENFYKAGFDNEIILQSVNKLLSINEQENYSTLDIALIDLEKQTMDSIKIGSPFGLVKREQGVDVVIGSSLPMGALESVNPTINRLTIGAKDIVILFTDGISDAFETTENLQDFVSALATTNPQTIAESILNQALRLSDMSAKDDMTVLVARIFLKN